MEMGPHKDLKDRGMENGPTQGQRKTLTLVRTEENSDPGHLSVSPTDGDGPTQGLQGQRNGKWAHTRTEENSDPGKDRGKL